MKTLATSRRRMFACSVVAPAFTPLRTSLSNARGMIALLVLLVVARPGAPESEPAWEAWSSLLRGAGLLSVVHLAPATRPRALFLVQLVRRVRACTMPVLVSLLGPEGRMWAASPGNLVLLLVADREQAVVRFLDLPRRPFRRHRHQRQVIVLLDLSAPRGHCNPKAPCNTNYSPLFQHFWLRRKLLNVVLMVNPSLFSPVRQ